ncbi:MAG TPA: hypothetical protein VGC01_03810 [Mucilaginibacter sp.]
MSEEHNFYVQAFYQGGMNSFEVIPDGNNYRLARDGKIIAELNHDDSWQQTGGEPLPQGVLESIYQEIDQKKA